MTEPYQPVSCRFYDELEVFATLGTSCEITVMQPGSRLTFQGKITDLYTRDKVEYLKLDTGPEIRLDHITQVNGIRPAYTC